MFSAHVVNLCMKDCSLHGQELPPWHWCHLGRIFLSLSGGMSSHLHELEALCVCIICLFGYLSSVSNAALFKLNCSCLRCRSILGRFGTHLDCFVNNIVAYRLPWTFCKLNKPEMHLFYFFKFDQNITSYFSRDLILELQFVVLILYFILNSLGVLCLQQTHLVVGLESLFEQSLSILM